MLRQKSVRISTIRRCRNLQRKTDIRLDIRFVNSGSVLLSRAVAHQVSSALKSLTTVFGMGTGVTSLLLPPNICQTPFGVLTSFLCVSKTERRSFSISFFCSLYGLLHNILGQALDLLVSVSLIHYCTYTSDLSTT